MTESSNDTDAENESTLATAEGFIDAFYSWNADSLARMMDAPEDAARALYYQAWAEAGNYEIERRRPCQIADDGRAECSITVRDDIGGALGYLATDVFRLSIEAGRIVGVDFSGDDPPVFDELFAWMAQDRPEVFAGPCKDLFAGGETPADCVRAVVRAARDFAKRECEG
jgi:hypothetical protein